jgi:uncharacterized membrane protein
MEKQPDKLDILMDWFLGDAKEITSKLESVTTSVTETVERLDKASDEIKKSSEVAKTEVIASQRELVNTLKKEQKVSDQFFERLAGAQTGFSQALIRQILIITVVCSFVGGALGAAAITFCFTDKKPDLKRPYPGRFLASIALGIEARRGETACLARCAARKPARRERPKIKWIAQSIINKMVCAIQKSIVRPL